MLNSEFIKDKFLDKYIYKGRICRNVTYCPRKFARMLHVFLQKYYLLFRSEVVFCRNVTYSHFTRAQ